MKNINIYSNKFINIISFIFTIIILFCIFYKKNTHLEFNNITNNNVISENIKENNNNIYVDRITEDFNWFVEIPSINLKAPIKENTEMETLNLFVGHFKETPLTMGNVCLAGHNRGYEKNYFENIKKLKMGDKIKYKYNDFEKVYNIDVIEIIKETNWKYLENTDKNKITLITCVEGKPEFRRCIQATEIN